MPCYRPLKAYRGKEKHPSGKHRIVFKSTDAMREEGFNLPCGQCTGCRLDRSNAWALRLSHEAKTWGEHRSHFVTLTYSNEHVPVSYSLDKRALQLFHKRVYKRFGRTRYFGVGENGDSFGRPHYHTLLFGPEFKDLRPSFKNERGEQLYTSETLSSLWPFGFHQIGPVTYESASYVARYCVKRQNGKAADDHYWRCSPIDAQMYRREPEFAMMSLRPGIGAEFARKYATDFVPADEYVPAMARPNGYFKDFITVDGRPHPIPDYYRKLLISDERKARKLKLARLARANTAVQKWNRTPERLKVREFCHEDRIAKGGIKRPQF